MSQTGSNSAAPLTVALVHGAFADASGWNGVAAQLLAAGLRRCAEGSSAQPRRRRMTYERKNAVWPTTLRSSPPST